MLSRARVRLPSCRHAAKLRAVSEDRLAVISNTHSKSDSHPSPRSPIGLPAIELGRQSGVQEMQGKINVGCRPHEKTWPHHPTQKICSDYLSDGVAGCWDGPGRIHRDVAPSTTTTAFMSSLSAGVTSKLNSSDRLRKVPLPGTERGSRACWTRVGWGTTLDRGRTRRMTRGAAVLNCN